MGKQEIVSPGLKFGELLRVSWNALKGNWLITIGTLLLFILIQLAASWLPLARVVNILLYPLTAGLGLFYLNVVRGNPLSPSLLFKPFEQFGRFIWANVRCTIFIFLWGLLLVIPGIIAGYRYSMTPFIMLDDPEISVKDAMRESCEIMYGHKLQFWGYNVLWCLIVLLGCALTLGIGAIWLVPLTGCWIAAFYDSIRRRGPVQPEAEPEDTETVVDAEVVS